MTRDRRPAGPAAGREPGPALDYPRLLLAGLAVAVLVGVVVAGTTSAAAFGVYNPGWEGTSELRGVAEAAGADPGVVTNASRYGTVEPAGTVAVVLSPDRAYTDREAARIRTFVRAGGTLVVGEDFGSNGGPLLAAVGAGTRFDGALLRDERSEWRSPAMPVATGVTNRSATPYTEGVGTLTLNYGTALDPGPNATVLVRSSPFAYLDADGDGSLDDGESLEARPVVAVEPVGEGRVVAVSDPSVFLNGMLDREGNRRFARNLLGAGDRALFDQSGSTVPPLSAALLLVRSSPALGFGVAAAVLSLVGAWGLGWVGRLGSWLRTRASRAGRGADRPTEDGAGADVDADALVAYLRRRHPDWDEDRARRVAQGVLPAREQRREDE
ncbi:MAG: DUF4350 domain-containing protein [Haloarculaceae archaeon]